MISVRISAAFLAQASKPMMPLAGAAVKGHMFCRTKVHTVHTENPHEHTMNIHTNSQHHQGHSLWTCATGCTGFHFWSQPPAILITVPTIQKKSRKTCTTWDVRSPSKNWRFYRFSMSTGWPNFFHQNYKAGVFPLTGIGGAKARQEPPSEAMMKMGSGHSKFIKLVAVICFSCSFSMFFSSWLNAGTSRRHFCEEHAGNLSHTNETWTMTAVCRVGSLPACCRPPTSLLGYRTYTEPRWTFVVCLELSWYMTKKLSLHIPWYYRPF